ACNNRGICHDRLGDNEAAIADYTRAIELEDAAPPQIANALLNRGVTQGQLGNAAAALADYTRIVELKEAPPEHMVLALVNRATAHSVLGDARSETEDLLAALELSARDPTLQMHNLIHALAKTCWRLPAATEERRRLKGKIDALFGTMQETAKLALGTAFLTIAQRHGDARLWCESWDYLVALENAPIQENLGPLVAVRAHLGGAGDALHPLAVEERVFAQEFLSGFKEAG
ncbi:MAG: hypothetical protein CME06_08215, partial [Gemmatimonadetes bacterium]|nr:hypothetical protein [Gemmatimonadota bacterium]